MADPPSPDANESADAAHHVYIVACNDGTFYTGYTTDVERRVQEHNDGTAAKYTRGRRPVTLVHTESFAEKSAAMSREYRIKQLRRPQKEALIEDG
jgi:putative endonuclease